jgi:rhodanese-related sulfurtransferase
MSLIVDVRTREEYVMDHVKGALNIPLFDLEYYLDFLGGRRSRCTAARAGCRG